MRPDIAMMQSPLLSHGQNCSGIAHHSADHIQVYFDHLPFEFSFIPTQFNIKEVEVKECQNGVLSQVEGRDLKNMKISSLSSYKGAIEGRY